MIIDGIEFDDSGLMPKVNDEHVDWSRPDFSASDDPIAAGVTWIHDITTQLHMVWPAERTGS